MTQRGADARIRKQLDSVEQQLAAGRGKGAKGKRLDLLRRQAELGDQRDAAVVQARRAAAKDR